MITSHTEPPATLQAASPAPLLARLVSQRYDPLWLGLATLAVTALTFLFGLWGSGGRLAPPLDDTFIHFQYARQLAAGHPFEYNTGDPPSSGDSAFIYPFMLAPAYLLGLDGQKPLLYADALLLVAHLVAVVLLYKLAFRLGGRPLALFASLFLLLNGRLNYIFVSGMETGVLVAALIAFFWLWLRAFEVPGENEGRRTKDIGYRIEKEKPHSSLVTRHSSLAVVGVFTALLRPEGHILVSLVCLLTLAYLLRARSFSPIALLLLLPVLVGLLPYVVNIATTGHWQYNTAASKSIWYLPYSPLHEKVSLTAGYAINVMRNTYLGLEVGRSPFPLLAAPLAILGAGVALRNVRYRTLHVLMLLTFLGGVALALLLPPIQFNRYYQPYDFIFTLYFSIGLISLTNLAVRIAGATINTPSIPHSAGSWASPNSGTPHFVVGLAIAATLLPQFVSYFFAFSDSARDIYYQQMTFSDWIRQNTPPEARIGVNDTGAHKYMSDRYVVDLIGLTNNQLRGSYFGGWGTIYDTLTATPKEERPGYFLIHPNVFLNGIDESVAQSFLTPLYSIRVQNPIITAGETETLYSVDWDYALLDQEPTYLLHKGVEPLDSINVGDLESEKRHSYSLAGRLPSIAEPKSIVTTASYEEGGVSLTESGRRHSGWEEFTVRSVAGQPLTLVTRARLHRDGESTVMVWADGRQVGLLKSRNERGGMWQEYEYTIPAEFVKADSATIRVDATFDPGGPGFTSYRYWFYAP